MKLINGYRIRYWLGKLCKNLLGIFRVCGTRLNFTRHGASVCPYCGKRY